MIGERRHLRLAEYKISLVSVFVDRLLLTQVVKP